MKPNKGSFTSERLKGNQFAKGNKPNKTSFKKGQHYSPRTEIKKGQKIPKEWLEKRGKGEKANSWIDGRSKTSQYHTWYTNKRNRLKRINGSHTFSDWQNLKAQYNWTCPACKKPEPEIKLTEDHIIPLIKGGSNNIENIQPLCKSCNCKKYTKIIKYECSEFKRDSSI